MGCLLQGLVVALHKKNDFDSGMFDVICNTIQPLWANLNGI